MYICVDFDGTCAKHDYPRIGEDIGAIPILKRIHQNGHKIILYTMRSGETLRDAVRWLEDQGVVLYDVNNNPSQKSWTKSPKVYAQIYIDDSALGTPLKFDGLRSYVDWEKIQTYLERMKII